MANQPYRLIIWGPGEVGGAVLRAAIKDDRFEVVGVKVFSPGKDGKDAGELVGLDPIGVKATTSKDDILALDADVVVVTSSHDDLGQLDRDVIDILASGKNVITTVAYHNAARRTYATPDRPPVTEIQEACAKGNTSVLGAGIHPTFMAEKLAMTMAQLVTEVTHVRIVEALNFQRAAENMWGGLRNIGFGGEPFQTLEQREGYGSIYYGDCATTIGHELYGAGANDVWVESERRGLPARKKVEASGLTIEEGEVAVLHLIHRGYLNDRHFFTNEEIWYIGRDNAFQGDDLPFDGFKGPAAYVIEISGQPADLRTQLEFKSNQRGVSPITNGSVRSVLDAVPAVCAAEPGILIDDVTPHVKLDDRIPPLAG